MQNDRLGRRTVFLEANIIIVFHAILKKLKFGVKTTLPVVVIVIH